MDNNSEKLDQNSIILNNNNNYKSPSLSKFNKKKSGIYLGGEEGD